MSISGQIKNYFVDTTGLLLVSIPIAAAVEIFIIGLSISISLESRIKVIALAYLGLGLIYAKGRDFSKKLFKIEKNSSEKIRALHDSFYTVLFNIILSLIIYLSSGANLSLAANGAVVIAIVSFISGPISGYSIDSFRDFTGTKNSDRKMPAFLKNAGSDAKKIISIVIVITAVVATAGIYLIKSEFF
ncbi:MAG: L-alanine exporter AlaE [Nanoarchaeota archaeon]